MTFLGATQLTNNVTQFEMGSKNHEVVPTCLAIRLSGLKTGSHGALNSISTLAKADLISRLKKTKCTICFEVYEDQERTADLPGIE